MLERVREGLAVFISTSKNGEELMDGRNMRKANRDE